MNLLLLAARAFYLALVAVAPALLAAASSRTYSDVCGALELSLMGLAVLAIATGARSAQALNRQLMLPALLALATLGLALRAAPAHALERASLGAFCLAATLAALGTQHLLGEPARFRFTGRVVGVTALGALGLVGLLPFGLGRDPGTVFAGAIGAASVGSLILAAARFESAFAAQHFSQVRARTTGLLLGTWLGMTALAAASLGAALLSLRASANVEAQSSLWLAARDSARVSWSCALPMVAALLAVFAGRTRETGLDVLNKRDFSWAVVAVALPATLAFGVFGRGQGGSELAVRPQGVQLAHEPSVPHAALPAPERAQPSEPAPAADAVASAAPSTSDSSSEVGVEVSAAEGVYEEDARRSILRRIERGRECIRRNPSAHGILSVKVVVDPEGSVTNVVPLSGDLLGSDFAKCAMLWMYRVGFAAPRARESAKFEVTLHFPGGKP